MGKSSRSTNTPTAEESAPGVASLARVWQFLTGWSDTTFREQLPEKWLERLLYPADIFALTGAVLRRAGAYARLLDASSKARVRMQSVKDIDKGVKEWRRELNRQSPNYKKMKRIRELWTALWTNRFTPLFSISDDPSLLAALADCLAMADEVSWGCGLPFRKDLRRSGDYFLVRKGWRKLEPTQFGSSLCSDAIDVRAARVLPKMHTPSSGLTLRSFSHHLALCETDEVQPRWFMIPGARGDVQNQDHINLLVVPWPEVVPPSHVTRSEQRNVGRVGSEAAFYFRCDLKDQGVSAADKIEALCEKAKETLGSLDGVVLPELALSWDDYRIVRKRVLSRSCLLVAGIGGNSKSGQPGENYLSVDVPLSTHHAIHFRQGKHHRWRLDGRQIRNYGIGARLHPSVSHWEDIDIADRRLLFLVLRPWLVTTVLICEDLARHDPVGELLRGVGPHLVIALLMDGPQLANRWSSRYASVLADDPGSSVLTVSSLGMAGLSRPDAKSKPSRTVALWKDAYEGVRELDVADGANALALTISVDCGEEVTADGRTDDGISAFPALTGFHSISLPENPENWARQTRPEPTEILEDERRRYLSPHEAAALARLVQQDIEADPYPSVLRELTGEALAIAREIWRQKIGHPDNGSVCFARAENKYCNLPTEEQCGTASCIKEWAETNKRGVPRRRSQGAS